MRQLAMSMAAGSILSLLFADVAFSQPGRGPGGRGGNNFGPAVGSKLPDVTVFDSTGKPFRLSSLKGSHTVLVFGCLT